MPSRTFVVKGDVFPRHKKFVPSTSNQWSVAEKLIKDLNFRNIKVGNSYATKHA